jgi:RNA polymerase sigma factor (sigma-70 family)
MRDSYDEFGGGDNLAECVDVYPSASEVYAKEREARMLRAAFQHLTARQSDVMELRHGLGTGRDFTQAEVAAMLGISQPAVAEHEAAALRRLRKILADKI